VTPPAEIPVDAGSSIFSAATIRDAIRAVGDIFQTVNIETARLDARVLACHAFDKTLEDLLLRSDNPADATALELLAEFCRRRVAGEPVARILGTKEFWSLEFELNDATLVPRPETELCVETGLALLRESNRPAPRILDLGTGSGCILIALLSELPMAEGIGIDIAAAAIDMARGNATKLGVSNRGTFYCRSWDEDGMDFGSFDLIVANPPYIPARDINGLAPEVRDFDPVLALSGGEDGLDAYRKIADFVPALLSPGGFLVAELGDGQATDVAGLFEAAGLSLAADWRRSDLAGKVRVMVAKKR
jgi:release factor glutamine methyltransferase